MPYNKNQIPDAPLPVSMMSMEETPLKSDLLYLAQLFAPAVERIFGSS